MSSNRKKSEALNYHQYPTPGKIQVVPTKKYATQRDLSLAYSPGVAEPCLAIQKNPDDVYKYTSKGNLVAVISNCTAVLGLGDIGAEAGKPVMEGKGLLFKIFADIDVFDIEVDTKDVDEFVETVKAIAPTFGGINLEDIKAPEAFEIERRLKEELNIPVMHDDQHGTAIISSAAIINALELANKNIKDAKLVVSGAGSAAVSCTRLYKKLGFLPENIVMCDSKGVIRSDRPSLTSQKKEFATKRDIYTLEDAMKNADIFLGLSKGGLVKPKMIKSMAKNPIVFALANPVPEIEYSLAMATRDDLIMGTGRSDYPNQINNILGFPYIFRAALDVRATKINEEMKMAAVYALANLTRQPVPEQVKMVYNKNLSFGKDYIIPKPFDIRLISEIPPAIAKAAMDSGVAQNPIKNWEKYKNSLAERLGTGSKLMRMDVPIIDPKSKNENKRRKKYADVFWEKRKRRGITMLEAKKWMRERNYFAAMMVNEGEADALVTGYSRNYPTVIKPLIELIGKEKGIERIAATNIMLTKRGPIFLSDTAINVNPTARELAKIAKMTDSLMRMFGIKPNLAMLSYSNFGSSKQESAVKVADAVAYLHRYYPEVCVDGETQADFALNPELLKGKFPFSKLLNKKVNGLIFPNLDSANISYKLMKELNNIDSVGPLIMGMKKPVHILQLGANVDEIVNMVSVAVVDAQEKAKI